MRLSNHKQFWVKVDGTMVENIWSWWNDILFQQFLQCIQMPKTMIYRIIRCGFNSMARHRLGSYQFVIIWTKHLHIVKRHSIKWLSRSPVFTPDFITIDRLILKKWRQNIWWNTFNGPWNKLKRSVSFSISHRVLSSMADNLNYI